MFGNSFWKNTSGGMAINFAIALTTIAIGVGAAVDISLLQSEKSKLQDWADSTALAAAVSGESADVDLQSFAEKFMQSSPFPDATVDTSITNGNLLVGLSQTKELAFMGAFGENMKNLYAEAEVPLPGAPSDSNDDGSGNNYNIALVLDMTSSMKGLGRLDALKDATHNFFTDLEEKASDDTMVSLVPFNKYVRISESNKDEPWIEVPADLGTYNNGLPESWEGCMNSRRNGYHKKPDFEGRRLQGFFLDDYACQGDRNNELVPLTDDWGRLNAAIQGWRAEGETYIPAGLIWGWRTLSPNAPFTEASQNPDGENVMILMTDGDNSNSLGGETKNSNGVFHLGEGLVTTVARRAIANTLTSELCEDIKADGIRLITLTFRTTNDETKEMFRSCASSPSDYYDSPTNESLLGSFEAIESGFNSETTKQEVRLIR